jgi:homoaconitase/3-isopropylmalate dehydratase large subunit
MWILKNSKDLLEYIQSRSKNLKIEINGELDKHVSAKDVALCIIGKIGTAGGTGYAIEFLLGQEVYL